jgi:NADP-dependent 3-hydroxy acid dehydrogenase YdfG
MTTPVVLITGALTGIGRATAPAFAQEGARIVVSGRRDQKGHALTQELRARGVEAEFVRADVRHEDDVCNLVDKTVARFGRLDVAVNNAGTEGKPGPVTEQTTESYAATFDTNVLGVLLSMKHEMRVMQAQGSGSIVNLSSTMGHRGAPGASLYTASKHAVEGIDEIRSARRCGIRYSHQCDRARSCRNRNAEPVHRHRREKGRTGCGSTSQACGHPRGDRRCHRIHRFPQGVVHHRPDHQRERRQNRFVIQYSEEAPSASLEIAALGRRIARPAAPGDRLA